MAAPPPLQQEMCNFAAGAQISYDGQKKRAVPVKTRNHYPDVRTITRRGGVGITPPVHLMVNLIIVPIMEL